MRWAKKVEPKVGDKRHKRKFAWFPIQAHYDTYNRDFTIWLEFYYAEQEYITSSEFVDNILVEGEPYWSTIRRYIIYDSGY